MMVFGRLLGKREDPEVRGYIESMLILAMADGELEDEEIDDIIVAIVNHPKMSGLSGKEIDQIARRSLIAMEKQGLEDRISSVAKMLPSKELRLDAIRMSLSVSMADGELEPQEMALLQKMQQIFGLSDEQISAIVNEYGS
jgi:tellurite resistance protein